jgi:hypothetical protein
MRLVSLLIGAAIGAAVMFWWDGGHWSAKACSDVQRPSLYFNEAEASPELRAALGYALLSIRQFDCGEDTTAERRAAEKAMGHLYN